MEKLFENVGKTRGIAILILEMVEEMLSEKGVVIPDEDRNGADEEACLYGTTYSNLENKIVELLVDYIDE